MPNVAELITEHVTLTVDCGDRLYLNAYMPRLQSEPTCGLWSGEAVSPYSVSFLATAPKSPFVDLRH